MQRLGRDLWRRGLGQSSASKLYVPPQARDWLLRRSSTHPGGGPPAPGAAASQAKAEKPAESARNSRAAAATAAAAGSAVPRPPTPIPLTAKVIGYGGLLPFAATSFATVVPELQPLALYSCATYSCSILSFLGAVHWGVALSECHTKLLGAASAPRVSIVDLTYGVLPSLVAAGAGVVPARDALTILIPAYVAAYGYDAVRFRRATASVPPWYMVLRQRLTLGACLCMAFAYLSRTPSPQVHALTAPVSIEGEVKMADASGKSERDDSEH
jgi:Protein of unknown function (DUF3429)